MNEVLRLRGRLSSRPYPSKPGMPQLPTDAPVSANKLRGLARQLDKIRTDWENGYVTKKILVSVHYERVIAKSRRMQAVLSERGGTSDETIVGAKFDDGPHHVITHCVSKQAIAASIELLKTTSIVIDQHFSSIVSKESLARINSKDQREKVDKILNAYGLSRSRFTRVVVDVAYVDRFEIDEDAPDHNGEAIVSLFETGELLRDIFAKLDIPYRAGRRFDDSTIIMPPDEYRMLKERAPYLISMSAGVVDWSSREPREEGEARWYSRRINPPANEPVIGVIDTLFKKNKEQVYFSDWVEYHEMVDPRIPRTSESYVHGTKVSSIIVDGPSLNPQLDDGCGHFRVRHFGVATESRFSLITVLRNIENIVVSNPDIRVWNLSLGSPLAVPMNSISPMAALLDRIQVERDVVFVIAGTNDTVKSGETMRIGSPADSINGIVVNSVRSDGSPASYSRRGPVLSFFNKPDVSYYGGDAGDLLLAYAPGGESYARGTSYAAPWIARKLAYLIHVMGLSKECAKALVIDSALGWSGKPQSWVTGYGVVPTHINDILKCRDDEIKFIIQGTSAQYDTYSYRIPVPTSKGKQPYYVKATMCYFPSCSRKQGVDYTDTELDLKIGRLNRNSLQPINNDMQGEAGHYIYEEEARKLFRKWDNVKYVGETIKQRQVPKKMYHTANWGISVQAKQRLSNTPRESVDFGIVVTLREMNGVNRVNEFIRSCNMYEWRVSSLDVRVSEEIFNLAEEEIEFDD